VCGSAETRDFTSARSHEPAQQRNGDAAMSVPPDRYQLRLAEQPVEILQNSTPSGAASCRVHPRVSIWLSPDDGQLFARVCAGDSRPMLAAPTPRPTDRAYADAARPEEKFVCRRFITELIEGDSAEAIIDVAKTRKSDVIVMGSRGLGRLAGLVLGSTSQKVVSHAPCPVLIVR